MRPVRECAHRRVDVLVITEGPAPGVEVDDQWQRVVTLRSVQTGRDVGTAGDHNVLDVYYRFRLAREWPHGGHHRSGLWDREVCPAREAPLFDRDKQGRCRGIKDPSSLWSGCSSHHASVTSQLRNAGTHWPVRSACSGGLELQPEGTLRLDAPWRLFQSAHQAGTRAWVRAGDD